MPNVSCSTFTTGARQLVVQEAFEMMLCFAGSYVAVVHAQHDGDVFVLGRRGDDDLLHRDPQVLLALVASVNMPVDSTTISAPTEAQSISAGSCSAKILIFLPPTVMESAVVLDLFCRLPRIESYFSRCASVSVW